MKCQEKGWHYILRYKQGSIPTIAAEYKKLRKIEKNLREENFQNGMCWYDFVMGIDYNGYKINIVEYAEEKHVKWKKGDKKGTVTDVRSEFLFLTDLPVRQKTWQHL